MKDIFGQGFRDECKSAGKAIRSKLIEARVLGEFLIAKDAQGNIVHRERVDNWCKRHGMSTNDFMMMGVPKISKMVGEEVPDAETWSVPSNVGENILEGNTGIQYVCIKDLLPCPYNREIDQAKVDEIKKAIQDTGIIKPFVVTEVNSDGGSMLMITDGHHRHLALKELIEDGIYDFDSKVPVMMADEDGINTADGESPKNIKETLNEAQETTIFRIDDKRFEKEQGYRLPGSDFAVIEGPKGWIFTNNEAIHWVGELGKPLEIPVYDPEYVGDDGKTYVPIVFREAPAVVTIPMLEEYEIASTSIDTPSAIDWKEYIHYFGIKSRIGRNYNLLLDSMREIGAVAEMPGFWDKNEAKDPFQSAPGDDINKRMDARNKAEQEFYGTEPRDQFVRQGHAFYPIEDQGPGNEEYCDFCDNVATYQTIYPDFESDIPRDSDEYGDDLELALACEDCIHRLKLPVDMIDENGNEVSLYKERDIDEANDPFQSASHEDIQGRKDRAKELIQQKYVGLYDKFVEIANGLGFTENGQPVQARYQRHEQIGYKARKGPLTIEMSTDLDYAPSRMRVEVTHSERRGWRANETMHLSNKLRTQTIINKIEDDIIPRFAGGDVEWAAKYTPKARYKRPCGVCGKGIPAGTKHMRMVSGQTICKDCVKKAAGQLGEGVWIEPENDVINEDLEGVHPQKKEWIETGDERINQILPELSPEEKRYLETVASESYEETVQRVQNYTGLEVNMANLPSLFSLLMETLQRTIHIEASNKTYLEELALSLVFEVPEFKVVEDAYLNDDLKFDIQLGQAELGRLTEPEEPAEDELTQQEEINLDLADAWEGQDETDIQRKFSNLMISGGSINKLYLFNMALDKLERINADLPTYYGILASVAQIGYWITPFGIEQAAAGGENTAAGSEEVVPEGDKYVIKVRALTFPFLVHELVKGIYEYLAIDPSHQQAMQKDTIEDETKDIMAGPGIYKTVMSYVPTDKQELMPLIQRKLTSLSSEDIRNILAKNDAGQRLMGQLIQDAEREWSEYQSQKEEYNQ